MGLHYAALGRKRHLPIASTISPCAVNLVRLCLSLSLSLLPLFLARPFRLANDGIRFDVPSMIKIVFRVAPARSRKATC